MARKKPERKKEAQDGPEEKETRLPWEMRPNLTNPIPRLLRAMEAVRISQSEMARRTAEEPGGVEAVYQTRISKWLKYEGCPDSSQMDAMCRAMDISIGDIFELKPEEITYQRLLLRRRIRHQIALIGEEEAEKRLAGLPMAPPPAPSAVVPPRPLGHTEYPRGVASKPRRAKRKDQAKPRPK